mgnify:CR=1 FL=1
MTTHEELLTRIGYEIYDCPPECEDESHAIESQPWLALRAVLDLHKPEYANANEYSATYCSHCGNMEAPACYWPCPTVQVIDVELS